MTRKLTSKEFLESEIVERVALGDPEDVWSETREDYMGVRWHAFVQYRATGTTVLDWPTKV